MSAPRVLLVPLAATGRGPWDGLLGRRLIARLARSLRAAGVAAHAEVQMLTRGDEPAFLVGSEAPSDDELRAAAQEIGAEWCVGGSVAVTEAMTLGPDAGLDPAADPGCRLSLRLVPAAEQPVSAHGGDRLDGDALLDAMRAALVDLYDKLGISRGARSPFLDRSVSFPAYVALARAEDLASSDALGQNVARGEVLAAHLDALTLCPDSRELRDTMAGLCLELGLSPSADQELRAAAATTARHAAGLCDRDTRLTLTAAELDLALGNTTTPLADALQILDAQPAHSAALSTATRATMLQGDLDGVRDLAVRYTAGQKDKRAADLEVAGWWLAAGRPDQALAAFAQLHEIDPTDGEAALGAGRCLALLGELSEARRLLQLASAVVESDSPLEQEALLLLRRVETDLSASTDG